MQVLPAGQALKLHATHSWRKLAFDFALALVLAWACAVLVDRWRAAAAPPPCESAVHRLLFEPTPHPRCLTFQADLPV